MSDSSGDSKCPVVHTAITFVAEPGVLRSPVGISFWLPDIYPAKAKTEGLETHRLKRNVASEEDIKGLKSKILTSGLSISELVSTAWASAATFRGTDMRSVLTHQRTPHLFVLEKHRCDLD